ncbi:MAG: SURF1 family protein [Gammaproteobacteria bacterium]|nr:SURF1 family protein [Gammaproteobacteria bacterium]MBT8150219.1 SURF1 family protein [Gammaproteobacteria bacterium]NNL11462.1 SURF1 family protein [Pseudomonadales bacterium]RZV60219.1 MAG: SURF1 family protein [Pseudomonadales bacterium]
MIRSAYHFNANWKVWLFVLLLLPLLLRLGFWQLQRADEKRLLLAQYEQQGAAAALAPAQLAELTEQQLAFRRVRLSGLLLEESSILLDNQIRDGRVGYHLLQPFIDSSGIIFLLNRGWIAGAADRSLPTIPRVERELDVVASVHVPLGKAVVLGQDSWPAGWPLRVQAIDVERVAARLRANTDFASLKLYPYVLRIQQHEAAALAVNWPPVNTRPEKHTGYAVQWFAMSLALLVCGLFASLSRRPER